MAFHIKNAETEALARRLAALRGVGLTEAVTGALRNELARVIRLPINRAKQRVLGYIDLLGIEQRPVPPEASRLALEAFDRYGKGRHPAALNFGEPLLYKGGDFARTDIGTA